MTKHLKIISLHHSVVTKRQFFKTILLLKRRYIIQQWHFKIILQQLVKNIYSQLVKLIFIYINFIFIIYFKIIVCNVNNIENLQE